MNRILLFISIAIFSIFIGAQITEGILLVPYWESLSAAAFYDYYSAFGPSIGRFYSILTILAVLIPLGTSIYCFLNKSPALKHSVASTIFAILIIAIFYLYFKDVNQQFYKAAFDADQLKSVLTTWKYCHWLRVTFEILSLVFLILTFNTLSQAVHEIEA